MVEFIGIGAHRSGTSWIGNVLRAHPEVCMSEPKELRYFNRHLFPVGRNRDTLNPNHGQDIDWYLKRFAHAQPGQRRGEISPNYMVDEAAPQRIREMFPHAKLILALRNPVDQVFSNYKLHHGNHLIGDLSFEAALTREPALADAAHYSKHLDRWLRYFPREQFHVILFEDLIERPLAVFRSLFEFLGVKADVELEIQSLNKNESARLRSRKLHNAAQGVSRKMLDANLAPVLSFLRRVGVHALVNLVNRGAPERYDFPQHVRDELVDRYRDVPREVSQLVGIDTSLWVSRSAICRRHPGVAQAR